MAVLALALVCVALSAPQTRAEQFLTPEEARRVCFPAADRFESQTVIFTSGQSKAIEKASGVKVRNRGNRLALAYEGAALRGVVIYDHVLGKHELIDYAVAFNPEGEVLAIEILEYRESHGGEVRDTKWRGQFVGKHAGSTLSLHEDIYNISGATISCRNVTEGVRRLAATYREVVRPRLLAFGELPVARRDASPQP